MSKTNKSQNKICRLLSLCLFLFLSGLDFIPDVSLFDNQLDSFPRHLHHFTFPLAAYEVSSFTTSSPALTLRFYHYYGHTSSHTVLYNLRFYFFCHTAWQACGISVPQPGIKPIPPALEAGILTTRLPGKSLTPAFILINHQDLK